MWHPQRHMEHTPPSEAEANLAVLSQRSDGLQLFAFLPGHTGSSTRLEIAGAIIAIAGEGPINLGTDSQSFRNKALHIHKLIQDQALPRRPWMLQCDGDLWQLYYQCAQAKTVAAITITKVKGHATNQMVQQGLSGLKTNRATMQLTQLQTKE